MVGQPKRLALLACLALRRPIGFHQRNTFLALLWSDSDESHARNSLRNAIYHLRSTLGTEAVRARGAEEIGLDRDRFWCDAVAFERALDDGRPADALELYRGPLLQGFILRGAREFEDRLERRRRGLHRRAAQAARRRRRARFGKRPAAPRPTVSWRGPGRYGRGSGGAGSRASLRRVGEVCAARRVRDPPSTYSLPES